MAKSGEYFRILVAYIVCVAVGYAVALQCPWGPLWNAAAADVAATVVIFIFSRVYRNSSFYDPYWSVIPPLLVAYWMMCLPASTHDLRTWCAAVLVLLWAIRLTTNWSVYWGGLHHEDWRYPMVRKNAGKAGYLVDFLGIHLFPTFQVFLGCLPVYAVIVYAGDQPFGWLDVLAIVVTAGAILIELVADLQLHAFIATHKPGTFIQSGLWAWSRHPNYFGEVAFWWGLMLFGLAAAPQHWPWIIPGALAMTAMFSIVSIPMMDKRSMESRPGYREHMQRVSALVLWPPRR